MSMMWQCWTKRSISAETQAAPGKTVPHCLKGKLVRHHDRPVFVPATDDVVEQIGGLSAAREVADLVEDQERGGGVLAQAPLEGGQGLLLQEVGEGGGERGEAHGVALLEGEHGEVLGEHGLADAAGASKQDVVPLGDEAERARVVDALARDVRGGGSSRSGRGA